jgi:hypothetical protein
MSKLSPDNKWVLARFGSLQYVISAHEWNEHVKRTPTTKWELVADSDDEHELHALMKLIEAAC